MSKQEKSKEVQYSAVPTKDGEKISSKTEVPLKYGYGVRHAQLIIFFLSLAMNFIARGHLGVTLVAMTSHENFTHGIEDVITKRNYSNFNTTKGLAYVDRNATDFDNLDESNVTRIDEGNGTIVFDYTEEPWTIYRTYYWGKPVQEMVLTSFFLGYFLMMFPIALVCQRWGGLVPLQVSMFVNGIVSILTPWLALWGGWKAVCVCRVMQGLAQAGTYPGIQTLLAQWVPSDERATLSSYVYTGTTVGTVIGFQIGGLVSDTMGWPAAFWAIGLLCLLTGTVMTVFGAATPRDHKKISAEEKNYILGYCDTGLVQRRRTPWKAIMTSKPMWASFATHIGSGSSFVFFLTQLPSYIHYILGIDVKSSGVLSSLPYVASFFTSLTVGVVSDYITNRNIVSRRNARRICNTVSQVGVAASLICASYASSTTVAIICFVITMSCHMGIHGGWMVNHIDLAPNYSGTLMALGNTLTNIVVMVMPVLVSNIVIDLKNVYQWRIMMYLVAALAFIPNVIFVIFMSADVQPWNEGVASETEVNNVELETIKKKEAET